jgi:hypothetical protein
LFHPERVSLGRFAETVPEIFFLKKITSYLDL